MDSKKILPIKIVHMILMLVAFAALTFASIDKLDDLANVQGAVMAGFDFIPNLLALLAGFLYLIFGYKKNAAFFYKSFMTLTLISYGLTIAIGLCNPIASSWWYSLIAVASLILMAILAFGTDLGEGKTYVIALILLIIRIVCVLVPIINKEQFGAAFPAVLIDTLASLLLAGTAVFMVAGKYFDKAKRGTN